MGEGGHFALDQFAGMAARMERRQSGGSGSRLGGISSLDDLFRACEQEGGRKVPS